MDSPLQARQALVDIGQYLSIPLNGFAAGNRLQPSDDELLPFNSIEWIRIPTGL
mgnify:CR=1 FL=1